MKKNFVFIFLGFIIPGNFLFAQVSDSAKTDTVVKKQFQVEKVGDDNNLSPKAKKEVAKADRLFSLGAENYGRALQHYLVAFQLHPDNIYISYKIGQCYILTKKSKNRAIHFLERAYFQSSKIDPYVSYYLGLAYHVNQDYIKALEQYEKSIAAFKKGGKTSARQKRADLTPSEVEEKTADVLKKINECNNAIELEKLPKNVFLHNLGDSINSPYPDYDPFITPDENVLVFTSRRPDTKGGKRAPIDAGYFEDIYVSYKEKNKWTKAQKPPSSVNKKTNDAITGLSSDGTKLFIYRDIDNGDIYQSDLINKNWSKPKPIKEINSIYHESSATISPDGKTLYFSSDRPGGAGKDDIYYSSLTDEGKWSQPKNIGNIINTPYEESRVYMDVDGKTLYFSSKGHNTMGGYDVFKSVMDENGNWSTPENLGYPINSTDDDVSYIPAAKGKRGYYSSVRQKGSGDKDIYSVIYLDFEKIELQKIRKGLITIDERIDSLRSFIEVAELIKNETGQAIIPGLEKAKMELKQLEDDYALLTNGLDSLTPVVENIAQFYSPESDEYASSNIDMQLAGMKKSFLDIGNESNLLVNNIESARKKPEEEIPSILGLTAEINNNQSVLDSLNAEFYSVDTASVKNPEQLARKNELMLAINSLSNELEKKKSELINTTNSIPLISETGKISEDSAYYAARIEYEESQTHLKKGSLQSLNQLMGILPENNYNELKNLNDSIVSAQQKTETCKQELQLLKSAAISKLDANTQKEISLLKSNVANTEFELQKTKVALLDARQAALYNPTPEILQLIDSLEKAHQKNEQNYFEAISQLRSAETKALATIDKKLLEKINSEEKKILEQERNIAQLKSRLAEKQNSSLAMLNDENKERAGMLMAEMTTKTDLISIPEIYSERVSTTKEQETASLANNKEKETNSNSLKPNLPTTINLNDASAMFLPEDYYTKNPDAYLKKLNEEKTNTEDELALYQNALKMLQSDTQNSSAGKQEELQQASNKLEEKINFYKSIQASLQNTTGVSAESDIIRNQSISKLEAEINQLQNELVLYKENLRKNQGNLSDKDLKNIQEFEKNIKEKQKELMLLSLAVKALDNSKMVLPDSFYTAKSFSEQEKKNQETVNRINNLNMALKEANDIAAILINEKDFFSPESVNRTNSLDEKMKSIEAELNYLRQELEQAMDLSSLMNNNNLETEIEKLANIDRLEMQIAGKENELKKMRQNLLQLQKNIGDVEEKINKEESEKGHLAQTIDTFREQHLSGIKTSLGTIAANIDSLNASIPGSDAAKEKYIKSLGAVLNEKEKDLIALNNALGEAMKKVKNPDADIKKEYIKQLEGKVKEQEEKLISIKSAIDKTSITADANTENSKAKNETNMLKEMIASTEKQLNNSRSDKEKRMLQDKLDSLNAQLIVQELNAHMAQTTGNNVKKQLTPEEEILQLKQQIADNEKRMASANAEEKNAIQSKINLLNTQLKQKEQKVEQENISAIQSQYNFSNTAVMNDLQIQKEIASLEQKMKNELSETEKTIIQKRLSELNSTLADRQSDSVVLNNSGSDATSVTAKENELRNLKAQKAKLASEAQSGGKKNTTEILLLNKKIEALESEILRMKVEQGFSEKDNTQDELKNTAENKGKTNSSEITLLKAELAQLEIQAEKISNSGGNNLKEKEAINKLKQKIKEMEDQTTSNQSLSLNITNTTVTKGYLPESAFNSEKGIVLENILFDYDKASLRPESKIILDKLITLLNQYPETKVQISGHTDSKGSESYNLNLSEKRAGSVVTYLVSNGVSAKRITSKGYGELLPIAPNNLPDGTDYPEGRQKNRRTELNVVNKQ